MKKKKFNILDHELVPEHVILSKEEAEEVLKKFNIKPEQLPKILTTDPVVKAIGAKKGDIIKVIRKSKTALKSVVYRLVVEESEISPARDISAEMFGEE
ncbi:MAG: DNA-directed RNA polymerase subunit H [Thermoplasmata archaeon]|nr:MAG: DNA-directed RNA polymerase subunit H [Thermoplasmata archaeon]RKX57551.1 MAG: DNA-directed RNA polymerase subunit H [Thermodesulfobacteriota bacterium]RLF51877.1 MAG: DNA-directed RNA polymerase subunit H [Thermoplasmata archaeon]